MCYINGIQYMVSLTMNIDRGRRGPGQLTVILDHEPFPPTVKGAISQ